MRYHSIFALIVIFAATTACSLSTARPTNVPTPIVLEPTDAVEELPTSAPSSTSLPTATAIPTSVGCTPRADWTIFYTVVAGDTLANIALRSNSSVNALASANCLANPNNISVGQRLRVPQVPTAPLPPTATHTPTATVVSPPPAPVGFVNASSYINGDAGNFYLLRDDSVILTWENPPPNVSRATFFLVDPGQHYVTLGEDRNIADGISIAWTVPAGLRGHQLMATAHFSSSNVIIPSGTTLVGSAPRPEEGCFMSAANPEGVTIYTRSGPDAPVFGTLTPDMHVQILGQSLNGWYAFDPGVAQGGETGIARLRWVPNGTALNFSEGCIG